MKPSELELVKRKFPLSASVIRLNQDCAQRVCAIGTESDSRLPLECPISGETSGIESAPGCFVLTFTVYAMRPKDADNLRTKELQDALVLAGFFPDDNFQIIKEVRLRSRKAAGKKDERTEILIEPFLSRGQYG